MSTTTTRPANRDDRDPRDDRNTRDRDHHRSNRDPRDNRDHRDYDRRDTRHDPRDDPRDSCHYRDRRDDDRRDWDRDRDRHDRERDDDRRRPMNNDDRYRRDEHQDKRHFPGDPFYEHFMVLTKYATGIKKGNLYFPETSEHYRNFTYDHLHRSNRPRVPSGWDQTGTAEEQLAVDQYFVNTVQAGSRAGASKDVRPDLSDHRSTLPKQQEIDLAIALLPTEILTILKLTPDPKALQLVNSAPNSQSHDPNASTSLPNSASGSMDSAFDLNASSMSSMNQIDTLDSQHLTNHQLYTAMNIPGQTITAADGKILRPKVYVSGFPQSGISQDNLKEQMSSIIYQNLFLLEGRVPPRELVQPYTQQTAIRAIHCHPNFLFVEFTTLADGASALSLNGLPATITLDDGDTVNVTLVVRCPKDLNDHFTRHPPPAYIHPVIQEHNDHPVKTSYDKPDEIKTTGGENQFKIYIGNIDQGFPESDLRALFQSIPNLTNFNLPRSNQGGQQKIFGFATYATKESADLAVATYHSMQLGSRPLVVKHTISFGQSEDSANPYLSFPGQSSAQQHSSHHVHHTAASSGSQLPFVPSELPTEYLALYNIAELQEFKDEKDDILQDIVEGPASQFTKILAVRYRAADKPTPGVRDVDSDVCIFLQCEDQLKASQVLNSLHGKSFGSRAIQVKFIDSSVWNSFADNAWTSPF